MLSDQEFTGVCPDYLSVSQLLKATPVTEGTDRFVYLEASKETRDQQGEVVLSKALQDQSAYFLKFGNLDIDHYTQIGAKLGIPNYEAYEIGRPVDVRVRDGVTFVKGQIYSGDGPAADKANTFWSSLTQLNPPARWYPSVGGAVVAKSTTIDPETHAKRVVVEKVRWTNIGFSKTPVNADLDTVQTVPFGALAKSWNGSGFDMAKALTAGYGTNSASMQGGSALREQSLYGAGGSDDADFYQMADKFADAIRSGKVRSFNVPSLVTAARRLLGLSDDDAVEFVGRFLAVLKRELRSKK